MPRNNHCSYTVTQNPIDVLELDAVVLGIGRLGPDAKSQAHQIRSIPAVNFTKRWGY